MKETEKFKKFKKCIHEVFFQDESYDAILYKLSKLYLILQDNATGFNGLSAEDQYSICSWSYITTMSTSTHAIANIRIIGKAELSSNTKKFSLDYGYQQRDLIELKSTNII